MFLDRFRSLPALRNAPAFLVTIACSMALIACGGGGGGSNSTDPGPGPGSGAADPVPKPAELSLVVGNIQTFNGTGAKARITQPNGIAVDSAGNTYITEVGLQSVRKISPAGVVSVFAGDAFNFGTADGAGATARFSSPDSIAMDKDDNLYVNDSGNFTIRKILPSGLVTTYAGSAGQSGTVDGKGNVARFSSVRGIAVDPTGGLFVLDSSAFRKIAADGTVVTLPVPMDTFKLDVHMAADTSGNLFIASGTSRYLSFQSGVPLLHKITPAGVLSQVYAFSTGDVDGAVYNFGGIAVDGAGNVYLSNGNFTISFSPNVVYTSIGGTVLKLSPLGVLTTIAGTRGQVGLNDGQGLNASFDEPGKLALDRQGNLVLADVRNNTIRTISSSGVVSTLAGRGRASVDGLGDQAQLKQVVGLASDQRGNVVVAEYSALRRLSPSGILTTTMTDRSGKFQNLALDSRGFMYVTSYAGTFSSTYQYAPNGIKTGKSYGYVNNLAVDAQDNLYGASGSRIDNLSSQKTLAETGTGYIRAFTFDSSGNAYAADSYRGVILKISPSGSVAILAGVDGKPGYKDGAAGTAQFNRLSGIAVLGTDVYVSDTGNRLIRKISQDGMVTTIAGTLGSPDTVMGQIGSLYNPTYLTTESNNSLLVVVDGKAIVRIRLQ